MFSSESAVTNVPVSFPFVLPESKSGSASGSDCASSEFGPKSESESKLGTGVVVSEFMPTTWASSTYC